VDLWHCMKAKREELIHIGDQDSKSKLGELLGECKTTAQAILSDIKKFVFSAALKKIPESGAVTKITTDTLDFLKCLFMWKEAVDELLESGKILQYSSEILEALRDNLLSQTKKLLKDKNQKPLASVFLLNNYRYVSVKIVDDPLLLPNLASSVEKARFLEAVEETKNQYLSGWDDIRQHLQEIVGEEALSKDKRKKEIKGKFKGFNSEFEKQKEINKKFEILDTDLAQGIREELKAMIKQRYEISLYNKYGSDTGDAKISPRTNWSTKRSKYVQYSPSLLNDYFSRLFEGEKDSSSSGSSSSFPASAIFLKGIAKADSSRKLI